MTDCCPVCRLHVHPSAGYRIPRHRNGVGRWCETSGRDYKIVEVAAD
jgi:hypothetical protein